MKFELRWVVFTDFIFDPYLNKGTTRVLQFREGEYLEEDEEGWKDVPEEYINIKEKRA